MIIDWTSWSCYLYWTAVWLNDPRLDRLMLPLLNSLLVNLWSLTGLKLILLPCLFGRPPSGQTLQDDTWMFAGAGSKASGYWGCCEQLLPIHSSLWSPSSSGEKKNISGGGFLFDCSHSVKDVVLSVLTMMTQICHDLSRALTHM